MKSNYNCFKGQKYSNYISFGFYCGVSMELERLGLRSVSLPFDWLITADFTNVIDLVNNKFKGFLDEANLGQEYKVTPKYYYDDNLYIHYYHDFNGSESLDSQLNFVRAKYNRRIDRLYEKLSEPSLVIRYVFDKEEYNYICQHYDELNTWIKGYNPLNNFFFVIDSYIADNQCDNWGGVCGCSKRTADQNTQIYQTSA